MRSPLAYLTLLALPVLAAHAISGLGREDAGLDTRERAMALVNAGQQISAAQAIYGLRTGHPATKMADLVAKGSLTVPAVGSPDDRGRVSAWQTDGRLAYVSLDGDVRTLCAELSRQAGASRSGVAGGVGAGGDQFGCVSGADGARFVFRVQ